MRIAILFVLLGLFNACGARGQAAEQALINCGEKTVEAKVPELLPTVEAILLHEAVDWRGQLGALEGYAGEHAVACAVAAAAAAFETTGTAGGAQQLRGRSKAGEFVKARGWRFQIAGVAPSSSPAEAPPK